MKKLPAAVLSLLLILLSAASAFAAETAIPLPETLIEAGLTDAGETDSSEIYCIYESATREDLDYFLTLCSMNGIYRKELAADTYVLVRPGTDFSAVIQLKPEGYILLLLPNDCMMLTEEGFNGLIAYFTQPVSLPSGKGSNVFPEFFASIGVTQSKGTVAPLSGYFDDMNCWTEYYSDITADDIQKYTDEMILCGFDVWVDTIAADENDEIFAYVLHLSNGDAEIVLSYFLDTKTIHVSYKPGVSYHLLSGEEYAQYIPQR